MVMLDNTSTSPSQQPVTGVSTSIRNSDINLWKIVFSSGKGRVFLQSSVTQIYYFFSNCYSNELAIYQKYVIINLILISIILPIQMTNLITVINQFAIWTRLICIKVCLMEDLDNPERTTTIWAKTLHWFDLSRLLPDIL